jgi:hypothetical protein
MARFKGQGAEDDENIEEQAEEVQAEEVQAEEVDPEEVDLEEVDPEEQGHAVDLEEPEVQENDEPFPEDSPDQVREPTPPPPTSSRLRGRPKKSLPPLPDLNKLPAAGKSQAKVVAPLHPAIILMPPRGPPPVPLGADDDDDQPYLVNSLNEGGAIQLMEEDVNMPPLPASIFASEEELEERRVKAMMEDKALQKKKRFVNEGFKAMKEDLLSCIRMAESGEVSLLLDQHFYSSFFSFGFKNFLFMF